MGKDFTKGGKERVEYSVLVNKFDPKTYDPNKGKRGKET